MRQPVAVRVAVVPGRVMSCPASLTAAAKSTSPAATCRMLPAKAAARRSLPAAAAARQAARRHDDVVDEVDAEAAVLGGHRGGEVASAPERRDALEGEAPLRVVAPRALGELRPEPLRQLDEAGPCGRPRLQLEAHRS